MHEHHAANRDGLVLMSPISIDCVDLCCSKVMTGEGVDDMNPPKLYQTGRPQGYVGCKAPMFSFTRLR